MAQVINGHWTNDSTKAFLFRIAFDFVSQLEKLMDAEKITPTELAKKLGVTKGRVSQIMNNPGNLTLKTVVEWARALDVKVAIVAYDDGDVQNDNGPVNPQIFATCWEKQGRPTDFFAAGMAVASTGNDVQRKANWDQDAAASMEKIDPAVWLQAEPQGLDDAGTDANHVYPQRTRDGAH
jgi:transcriptional regulator with XRE-family HTH domain